MEMICKVCKNSANNKAYQIREMMLGFRDEFTYFECFECGCLQIAEIPPNMEKYYPSDYLPWSSNRPCENFIRKFLRIRRDRYALFNAGFIGKLLNKRYPRTYLCAIFSAIAKAGVNYESRILDVGCRSGELLYLLRDVGICSLVGIDPYIENKVVRGEINILKQTIQDLPDSQKFDLIVFNHSFEHMYNHVETLSKISDILAENGICLIRMPLKTERIWSLYGVEWVQIDAPRHFFIHTIRSINYLAKHAGLVIKDVTFDSNDFQFWGSEQYRSDIPMYAENSYIMNPSKSIFKAEQIKEFIEMAKELNEAKQGDQAALYLKKK